VLTSDKYALYDTVKEEVVKHLKGKKKESVPHIVEVSHDDKYCIEVNHELSTTVLLRNLVSNSIVAKFEGHSQAIQAISFVKNTDNLSFVSVAGNECLLWQTPEVAMKSNGTNFVEVLQPAKILDTESSNAVT